MIYYFSWKYDKQTMDLILTISNKLYYINLVEEVIERVKRYIPFSILECEKFLQSLATAKLCFFFCGKVQECVSQYYPFSFSTYISLSILLCSKFKLHISSPPFEKYEILINFFSPSGRVGRRLKR